MGLAGVHLPSRKGERRVPVGEREEHDQEWADSDKQI